MRWFGLVPFLLFIAACDVTLDVPAPAPTPGPQVPVPPEFDEQMTPAEAAQAFKQVVTDVEPVAERECRRLNRNGTNCDFLIVVDGRRNVPPNAYQSLDDKGRPVLTFSIGLIASVGNADELAFVMGHEAAHHIVGHLARREANAEAGAVIFGNLATLTGGGARDVANARELGAAVGARTYSKEFELEADELGTLITVRAGYDPLRGAEFFNRIPDPGDRFLGSHPPNAARLEIVRRTAERVGFRVRK